MTAVFTQQFHLPQNNMRTYLPLMPHSPCPVSLRQVSLLLNKP